MLTCPGNLSSRGCDENRATRRPLEPPRIRRSTDVAYNERTRACELGTHNVNNKATTNLPQYRIYVNTQKAVYNNPPACVERRTVRIIIKQDIEDSRRRESTTAKPKAYLTNSSIFLERIYINIYVSLSAFAVLDCISHDTHLRRNDNVRRRADDITPA